MCTHFRMRSPRSFKVSLYEKNEAMLHDVRRTDCAWTPYKVNQCIDAIMPPRLQQPLFKSRPSKFRRRNYIPLDTLALLLVQLVPLSSNQLHGEQSVGPI